MKKRTVLVLSCLLSIGATACGVGSVDGTVKGKSLDVADGVVMTGDQFFGAFGAPNAAVVVLTDKGQLCTNFSKGFLPKESMGLVFVLFQTDADKKSVKPEPGEYKLIPSSVFKPDEANAKTASVQWVATSNECKHDQELSADATGGTLKIDSIDIAEGGTAAGTFTLQFGEDSVKGSFSVNKCGSIIPKSSERVCE